MPDTFDQNSSSPSLESANRISSQNSFSGSLSEDLIMFLLMNTCCLAEPPSAAATCTNVTAAGSGELGVMTRKSRMNHLGRWTSRTSKSLKLRHSLGILFTETPELTTTRSMLGLDRMSVLIPNSSPAEPSLLSDKNLSTNVGTQLRIRSPLTCPVLLFPSILLTLPI